MKQHLSENSNTNKPTIILTSKIGFYGNISKSPLYVVEIFEEDLNMMKEGEYITSDMINNLYEKNNKLLIKKGYLHDIPALKVSDINFDDIYTDEENKYRAKIEIVNDSRKYGKIKFLTKSTIKIISKRKNTLTILRRFESYNLSQKGEITKIRDDSIVGNIEINKNNGGNKHIDD